MAMIAVVTVMACNDESRTAGTLLCGACWIVSRAGVEVAEDEAAALASCGECAPGTSCNRLYRPPTCARSPGRDGDCAGRIARHGSGARCEL